jgi:hypothetical protein
MSMPARVSSCVSSCIPFLYFAEGEADLSLLQSVQTSSGAYPARDAIDTGVTFVEVKPLGREAGNSTPSISEFKKNEDTPPSHHTLSWRRGKGHFLMKQNRSTFLMLLDIVQRRFVVHLK